MSVNKEDVNKIRKYEESDCKWGKWLCGLKFH